jgi:hypothetical protein
MRGKNLIILLVLAAILVVAAVMSNRKGQSAPPPIIGQLLFPELDLNAIDRIVVATKASTASVEKGEDGWVVVEKHGHPADFDTIRKSLIALSKIKIGDAPTLSEEKRASLGIAELSEGNDDTTLVKLSGSGGDALATLILGKEHLSKSSGSDSRFGSYPDGRFLSVDGGKNVYLVSETLSDFSDDSLDWMDSSLLDVSGSDLVKITLSGPEGAPLELTQPEGESTLVLAGLADNEEADSSKLSSIRNALSYLKLSDVADPSLTENDTGLTSPARFEAESKEGVLYTVLIGGEVEGDRRFARFGATLLEREPPEQKESTQAPDKDRSSENGESGDTAGSEPDADDVMSEERKKEISDLNSRIEKWTYVIDDYKADAMIASREDLVKEKEPEEKEGEETSDESPSVSG